MITKRIIPCLDVKDGRVVKGINFQGLNDVSSPIELGKYYSDNGADELVFYDITASAEGRALFTDILKKVAETIFIPLTVGGGINTLEDFDRVLKCGIKNPDLIAQAAQKYGDQCVVLSVDVKRVDGKFTVFAKGGRENTGMDAIEWIKKCVALGAGEVVVNSIDTDGVKKGFDLEMLEAVCDAVSCHRVRRRRVYGGFCDTVQRTAQSGCRSGGIYFPFWRSEYQGIEGTSGERKHSHAVIKGDWTYV